MPDTFLGGNWFCSEYMLHVILYHLWTKLECVKNATALSYIKHWNGDLGIFDHDICKHFLHDDDLWSWFVHEYHEFPLIPKRVCVNSVLHIYVDWIPAAWQGQYNVMRSAKKLHSVNNIKHRNNITSTPARVEFESFELKYSHCFESESVILVFSFDLKILIDACHARTHTPTRALTHTLYAGYFHFFVKRVGTCAHSARVGSRRVARAPARVHDLGAAKSIYDWL